MRTGYGESGLHRQWRATGRPSASDEVCPFVPVPPAEEALVGAESASRSS